MYYQFSSYHLVFTSNHIDVVMVSVHALRAVDRGVKSRSGQAIDYKIDICCIYAKHAALRSKSKDWLTRNQKDVSEWSDMYTRGRWPNTIQIQLGVLV